MTVETVLEAFRALPINDRVRVFDTLRDEMTAADDDLPEAFKRELDRRIADCDANPDDEFTLEEVMAEADEIIRECQPK